MTELDAASNGSVNDARSLREEAVYPPAVLQKRVYIIDEVHMLSRDAFNALLKIMEEPPAHLLFILATTEIQKVPATILSRCQRFNFKRILPHDMEQQLLKVAKAESIDLTPDGADLLARMANGALRDALSLLDQCRAAGAVVDGRSVLDTLDWPAVPRRCSSCACFWRVRGATLWRYWTSCTGAARMWARCWVSSATCAGI